MTQPEHQSGRALAGKLTSAYGIKGWVKVHSYTEPPENIFNFSPWFLDTTESRDNVLTVVIDDHRAHGKGWIAHIRGVDDRNQAEQLCQRQITVEMGELPTLPEGEYYWQQLIGLHVFTCYKGSEPILLGKIASMMETGANDILVVAPCVSSIDQRERLLPYVDVYMLKVDLAAGKMLVDWDPNF